MFESLMVKITKLEKDGLTIGELTTEICTSHYGQPEWSGCSESIEIGDKLLITDNNGGEPWKAVVVAFDKNDGWLLVETEDCNDTFYALQAENGWIGIISDGEGSGNSAQELAEGLSEGKYQIEGTIRLGDGWGCV